LRPADLDALVDRHIAEIEDPQNPENVILSEAWIDGAINDAFLTPGIDLWDASDESSPRDFIAWRLSTAEGVSKALYRDALYLSAGLLTAALMDMLGK
jgi:hypothetical protein